VGSMPTSGTREKNIVFRVGIEQICGLRLHQQVSQICVLNSGEKR